MMKLKRKYACKSLFSFVLATLLGQALYAGHPLFPFSTETELLEIGKKAEYNHIKQIKMFKDDKIAMCSAVKVDLGLKSPIYLTAAHCLENAKEIEIVGQESSLQPTHMLTHPNYENNPLDDIAAFWNTHEVSQSDGYSDGYKVRTKDISQTDLTHEDFIHSGFGSMRRPGYFKQAFYTCPLSYNSETKVFISNCKKLDNESSEKKAYGYLQGGDSGGALFIEDSLSSKFLVGIASSGKSNVYSSSDWRRVDESFLNYVKTVYTKSYEKDHPSLLSSIADEVLNTLTLFKKTSEKKSPLIDHTQELREQIGLGNTIELEKNPHVLLALGLREQQKDKASKKAETFYKRAGEFGLHSLCSVKFHQIQKKYDDIGLSDLISVCEQAIKFNPEPEDGGTYYLLHVIYGGRINLSTILIDFASNLDDTPDYRRKKQLAEKYLDLAVKYHSIEALRVKQSSSLEALKSLAQYGDPEAQLSLAKRYFTDSMCKDLFGPKESEYYCNALDYPRLAINDLKDPALAKLWLDNSVDAHYGDALMTKAKLLKARNQDYIGYSLVPSASDSMPIDDYVFKLYEDAAEQDNKEALLYLGDHYQSRGDIDTAARYWMKTFKAYVLLDDSADNQFRAHTVLKAISDGNMGLISSDAAKKTVLDIVTTTVEVSPRGVILAQDSFDNVDPKYLISDGREGVVSVLNNVQEKLKMLKSD